MCKLLIMSEIDSTNRNNALRFIHAMAPIMSVNDKDGMGYAAVNNLGDIFGERWFNNNEAFLERDGLSQEDILSVKKYKGFIGKDKKYDSFGEVDLANVSSITLHARMSTSEKVFFNTHPFFIDGSTLVHNGVISNTHELDITHSTCDSEGILNKYLEHDVMDSPKDIQKVASALQGYYACGIFSTQKNGVTILDIFKDSRAVLSGFKIAELGGIVFATSPYQVREACTKLGFNIVSEFEVASGILLRLNAVTGEVILTQSFDDTYKYKGKRGRKAKDTSTSLVEMKKAYEGQLSNDDGYTYTQDDLMADGWSRNETGQWSRMSR